jgi:hypothetical protein
VTFWDIWDIGVHGSRCDFQSGVFGCEIAAPGIDRRRAQKDEALYITGERCAFCAPAGLVMAVGGVIELETRVGIGKSVNFDVNRAALFARLTI